MNCNATATSPRYVIICSLVHHLTYIFSITDTHYKHKHFQLALEGPSEVELNKKAEEEAKAIEERILEAKRKSAAEVAAAQVAAAKNEKKEEDDKRTLAEMANAQNPLGVLMFGGAKEPEEVEKQLVDAGIFEKKEEAGTTEGTDGTKKPEAEEDKKPEEDQKPEEDKKPEEAPIPSTSSAPVPTPVVPVATPAAAPAAPLALPAPKTAPKVGVVKSQVLCTGVCAFDILIEMTFCD